MPYLVDELSAAAYMLAQFEATPTQSDKESPAEPADREHGAKHDALDNALH
jgi:hypothetical protein